MIRKLEKDKWQDLVPILKENILENYFNILGLVNDEDVYKEIYIQYSKEEENVFFTFEVPEDLKARTYVVKFNYYFGCSVRKSDGEWDEYTSKSDPIPYTVTFTVQ